MLDQTDLVIELNSLTLIRSQRLSPYYGEDNLRNYPIILGIQVYEILLCYFYSAFLSLQSIFIATAWNREYISLNFSIRKTVIRV